MSTMKAIVVETTGGVEVLQYKDWPKPSPGPKEILVKNCSIGVNFIDTYHRAGVYPLPLPFIPGREAAGEVVAVGSEVTKYKDGDRVVYVSGGSYAEFTALPATAAIALPPNVSYNIGAAALLQGLTALTMVSDGYPVKTGDYVLVHAAAGGVGLLLCQLSKLRGARVIGTVSTEAKANLAKQNGADWVINYSNENEDVVKRVNEITNGLGCHAVFDGVGKATWKTSLDCARRLGTFISFGNASGVVPPISISTLAEKNLKLMRPSLMNYLATPEEMEKWSTELFDLISQGKISFQIHNKYKLADVAIAHNDLEGKKTTGKLLLEP